MYQAYTPPPPPQGYPQHGYPPQQQAYAPQDGHPSQYQSQYTQSPPPQQQAPQGYGNTGYGGNAPSQTSNGFQQPAPQQYPPQQPQVPSQPPAQKPMFDPFDDFFTAPASPPSTQQQQAMPLPPQQPPTQQQQQQQQPSYQHQQPGVPHQQQPTQAPLPPQPPVQQHPPASYASPDQPQSYTPQQPQPQYAPAPLQLLQQLPAPTIATNQAPSYYAAPEQTQQPPSQQPQGQYTYAPQQPQTAYAPPQPQPQGQSQTYTQQAYPQQQSPVPSSQYPPQSQANPAGPPSYQPQPPYTGAQMNASPMSNTSSLDEDRAKLEEIVRLRKELEKEQERERSKRAEMDTWACSGCTYKNKLTVDKCEMCDALRPGAVNSVAAKPVSTPSPQPVSATPIGILKPQSVTSRVQVFPPGKWACSTCGLNNNNELYNCRACNTKRKPEDTVAGTASSGPSNAEAKEGPSTNEYSCPTCTLFNPRAAQSCTACSTPNPYYTQAPAHPQQQVFSGNVVAHGRPGNIVNATPAAALSQWNCGTCTFQNAATAAKCSMCGGANPNPPRQVTATPQTRATAGYPGGAVAPAPKQNAAAPKDDDTSDEEAVQWQKDDVVTNCNKCTSAFSTLKRRHHCRACGFVFCDACSKYRVKIKDKGPEERVCLDCYRERLK